MSEIEKAARLYRIAWWAKFIWGLLVFGFIGLVMLAVFHA